MTNPSATTIDPIAAVLMQVPRNVTPQIKRFSANEWPEVLRSGWNTTSLDEVVWIESELDIPQAYLPQDAGVVSLRRNATSQVYLLSKDRYFIDRFLEYLRALTEEYEPVVSRALSATVKPGWTCVDVGSHIGRISLLLAELVGPSGSVFSFDAFAPNIEDLKRLSALKGYGQRIKATHAAVTDGSATEVLLYPGRGESTPEWNLRGQDVEGNATQAKYRVPAVSLDNALGDRRIDLVKIDVEGCAAGVFSGMAKLAAKYEPAFLIEFHSEEERNAAHFLYERGYIVKDLQTGAVTTPGNEAYQCLAIPRRLQ